MPVFYKEKYSYNHIYPIPINNLTIIPKYPFLLTGKKTYHWQQNDCVLNEDTYICKMYPDDNEEDCIPNQILKKPSTTCQYYTLVYPDPFVEQVDSNHILVVTSTSVEVEEICKNTRIRQITGPTEIILDKECKIIINQETYTAQPDQLQGSSLLLPPLQDMTSSSTQFKLSKIKLDEIHQLHDAFNKLTPVDIQPFRGHLHSYWTWILLCILAAIICFTVLYLWTRCKRKTPSIAVRFQRDKSLPEDSATTSVEVPPRHPF